MKRTVLLNALSTHPGGGATVWAALLAGGKGFRGDLEVQAITSDRQVDSLLKTVDPGIDVHLVPPRAGIVSFAGEAKVIDEALGSDPDRIVLTQNRMTRGHTGKQVVLHVNLSRFQPGTGARGLKQRPAELVRNQMAKAALTDADANIFESTYVFEAAQSRYPGITINNPSVALVGIQAAWATPPDQAIVGLAGRKSRLLAMTSPQPHKDNDLLIHTMAELDRRDPGRWSLAWAGGRIPGLWTREQELAETLGVTDLIEWVGFLDHDRLALELDSCVALISASRVESFATVPLEAMARGVPAISTGEASMPQSVGDAGILVPAGDAGAFADAVLAIGCDEAAWLERSQQGRAWAATMTWDQFGRDVMEVVHGIAG